LSREAVKQKKAHHVLLMVDMEDIREGIWYKNREYLACGSKNRNSWANVRSYDYRHRRL
jgi:hypothetical protein